MLVDAMPNSPIKRSIEFCLENQRRFPLETANNLRGRLRRMKFTIYKRGAKGVSYVCSVKRKFREPTTVFAEEVQKLIEFIEQNQNVFVGDLPEKFLSIQMPENHMAPQVPVEKAPTTDCI